MDIVTLLIRHEGLRLFPYRDTVGKTSIGVGRNLTDIGITETEALFLLQTDIDRAKAACARAFPWAARMTETRQVALWNLMFNLGSSRLLHFRDMLSALQAGQYPQAASELLDSLYARQVGIRAVELANMIRKG